MAPSVRPFGSLPESQTGMEIDAALELAGVDRVEFALLASTTFKEARTLEELVTLISSTRRRGLDGMLRHVYYERFGGANSDPSLHVGIDGLRAIAAATGRYAGRSEPRFSGVWDMPLPDDDRDKRTKPVPEKCTMTVYAIVQGRTCAFEGVAWMEESYPGPGVRGRMWRLRPRGMLSIAAERQALRSAFPSETAGIGDHDEGDQDEPLPPRLAEVQRSVEANAAMHRKIFDVEDEALPPPPKRERPLEDLVDRYNDRLKQAIERGHIPLDDYPQWELPTDVTREQVLDMGLRLVDLEQLADTKLPDVTTRSALGQKLADLVEEAARLEVDFDDCNVSLPAPNEQVVRAIEKLEERVERKKAVLAGERAPEPSQETLV